MLRVTSTAAQMIHSLTTDADLPDGGLRIAQQPEHPGLTMELAPAPRAGERVLRQHGARLFLDRTASLRLGRQVLDARTNAAGSAFFLGR